MLPLIHYAHLLLGTFWLGGTLTFAFVLYPVLARMPAQRAKPVYDAIAKIGAPLLGAAGGFTMLLGPLRAYLGGGITSLADFAHPYAHMVITAFVLVLIVTIIGGRFRKRFEALLTDPQRFAQAAPSLVTRQAVIEAILLLVVLAIMVALGLGLY